MNAGRYVSKWMPVLVWMSLIFLGSTDALSAAHTSRFIVPFLRWLDPQMSWHTIITIHITIRKIGHVTEYAILGLLLWRALRGTLLQVSVRMVALLALAVAAMFAASDEFHQSFIPTRTPSLHDVMIDCVGAAFAIGLCLLLAARRRAAVRTTV